MKHLLLISLIGGCFLLPAGASGQSLNTILAKLQAVEARLNELDAADPVALSEKIEVIENRVAALDTEQDQEITRIHSRIEELSVQPKSSPVSEDVIVETIEPVSRRLDNLELELADIKRATSDNGDTELELLVADLNGLVGELKLALANPGLIEAPTVQEQVLAETPGYVLSGFGDFFYSFGQADTRDSQINIGQAELDFETGISDHIGFAGALVYDSGAQGFCLGDLFLDFNMAGTEGQLFSMAGIESGGIKIGQFDVPFGIDFNVYPSIERKLVSGPLVVEQTHECWGDFGLQVYGEGARYNVALYGVNGFGYETAVGDPVDMLMSAGGRVGIMVLPSVEIGGSYAGFVNDHVTTDMTLSGVDLQASIRAFSLKGEYVEHRTGIDGAENIMNYGYYCQGTYEFGSYFAVTRYGAFVTEGGEELTRTSLGLGYVFREGLEFRTEYQLNNIEPDRTFFQMVLGI